MRRHIITLALTVTTLFALTSCAGIALPDTGGEASEPSSSVSTQSVTEACVAVQDGLAQAGEALSSLASSDAMAQPEQTIATFTETIELLGSTAAKVGNADVLTATTAVQQDFTAVSDVLSRLLVDKNPLAATEVPGAVSTLQGSVEKLAGLCTP